MISKNGHVCDFNLIENICGIAIYREAKGKRIYRVKCSGCGRTKEVSK